MKTDQTGQVPSVISFFDGHRGDFVLFCFVLSCGGLYHDKNWNILCHMTSRLRG